MGLDGSLLGELKLKVPSTPARLTYAVKVKDAKTRLNPDYFHAERLMAIREQQKRTDIGAASLRDVADFLRDTVPVANNALYLGLANVASNTGELVNYDEEIGGQCFAFEKNDVLFARLRPYLNKVYRAESAGTCSPEFHVLRLRTKTLLPDYLAAILRSSLTLAQTRHMMTGNTHPRLANEDVTNLVIPIPPLETQERIAGEVQSRRERARDLRHEAERDWDAAKARFEAVLLGE